MFAFFSSPEHVHARSEWNVCAAWHAGSYDDESNDATTDDDEPTVQANSAGMGYFLLQYINMYLDS